MELLAVQQGDAAFRKLMAAPVSAPRKRIRKSKVDAGDSVDTSAKSLADIYRESKVGKRAAKSPLYKPVPSYGQWLRSFMSGADAAVELQRAKVEWAAIRGEPRTINSLPIAHTVTRLSDCIRTAKTPAASRASWPSFRSAQLDAIYAAEGIAGLLSVNATPAEINSRAGQFARAA